jgi:altronate hydrolase
MNIRDVDPALILLHPEDDVAICRIQLMSGQAVNGLRLRGLIPPGHKIALRDIAEGDSIRRYSQIIGFASKFIRAGEHVHSQNLEMGNFERDYAFSLDVKPAKARRAANFMGIRRANGKVATRNYIGILTSVNCSATVARGIADYYGRQTASNVLEKFPNVDGVIALTHGAGCAMDDQGLGMQLLRRTLVGYARHPNFAAVLVVGLGCEANQVSDMLKSGDLKDGDNERIETLNIQQAGGTRRAIELGVAHVAQMLLRANQVHREPCGVENLILGLQCGGSDGYSGISANPALGYAVDLLVEHGGAAILSETPEIYGAEHLLTSRAISEEVGKELMDRIHWWDAYVRKNGSTLNNNPAPGNKAGGLTTILEKSLGAIAKGGTTNLNAVYQYAEEVRAAGLVFMDTPGYDPVSATGQVAGGANLICFTTGRGSAYGCAPTPSLKLSTNSDLWRRQQDDIDLNCGEIIDGSMSVAQVGEQIFARLIATASGQLTKSEEHGYGQNEFVPWAIGAVL